MCRKLYTAKWKLRKHCRDEIQYNLLKYDHLCYHVTEFSWSLFIATTQNLNNIYLQTKSYHWLENINSSTQIQKKERFHLQTLITLHESQATTEKLSTQQSWSHNHKFQGVLSYLKDSATSFPICLITWLITCKLSYAENWPRMWNWLICISR